MPRIEIKEEDFMINGGEGTYNSNNNHFLIIIDDPREQKQIKHQFIGDYEIVNRLKERIEALDTAIKDEENNLMNIASGFKEITYRMIDNMKSSKELLRQIIGVIR